jgi:hypothetical protein
MLRGAMWSALEVSPSSALFLAALVVGCSGSSPDTPNQDGGDATADGGGVEAGATGPDDASASADGAITGHGALVAAGVTARSTNFRIVASLGDSPGLNLTSASPRYRLRGAVVGVSQQP